jgi:hypothetical protein
MIYAKIDIPVKNQNSLFISADSTRQCNFSFQK